MNLELYLQLMEEIKKRTLSIEQIIDGKNTTSFEATNIEFMCLQIRKILELISLGSLVANKKEFEKQELKYQKFWHAERILNDIERLNSDFYPKPVHEIETNDPNVKTELVNKTEGFLTKEDFVKIYEKCGKILHADNPFGSKVDFDFYEQKIVDWVNLIKRLLNSHIIRLKDEKIFYLIHMQENDGKSHGYNFGLVE